MTLFDNIRVISADEVRMFGYPNLSKIPAPDFDLSGDQKEALFEVKCWLSVGSPFLTLGGPAGTGKTTLVREILRNNPNKKFAITAPTNKATKVLRESLPEFMGEHCFTIHKANKLLLMNDAEEKYLTRAGKNTAFRDYDVIILDEASMVGSRMFEMVCEEARRNDTQVLFVGDPYQLRPVKDGNHMAFNPALIEHQLLLKEVVRQAEDNPIIQQAQLFRRLIDGEDEVPRFLTDLGPNIQYLDAKEFAGTFIEACRNEKTHGQNRAIAWQNKAVDRMALRARVELYGDQAFEGLVEGERVFTAAPMDIMYTDQEAIVESVKDPVEHPEYSDFNVRPVQLSSGAIGYQIVPEEEQKLMLEAARLKKRADDARYAKQPSGRFYQEWHEFKDAFADLRSVHAITAHRSQGSTFDSVWIDLADIRGNRNKDDRYRLLYVAVTRARNNVFLKKG